MTTPDTSDTREDLPTAVRCEGLTKTYGSGPTATRALRGVNLEVRTGELLMLVGPSGCGKTTLISIIAGVLGRDGGGCEVLGHDYDHMSQRETTCFRGKNIGFVFQAFNLIPTLTAAENVAAPLIINGARRDRAVDLASQTLGRVGFDDRMMRSSPVDLSGGQQQRVAIARALVHNPRLIVCDEPTSALDWGHGEQVVELLRLAAHDQGATILVVAHDARIVPYADQVVLLEDGRLRDSDRNGPHPFRQALPNTLPGHF